MIMKKIFTLTLISMLFYFTGKAQITNGDFEAWTSTNPDGWGGTKTATSGLTITKVTTNVHGGVNACGLTNTTTAHKRFTTTGVSVTSGTAYVLSFWVRGTGTVRTGMYTGAANSGFGYIAYNSYVTVSTSWTQVTQTLVPDTTTNVAEFIIDAGASADIVVDDVTCTSGSVPTVTIHDIQYSTTAPYVSAYSGQPVITGGIVTAKYNKGLFMQDASGPWSGVYVYDSAKIAAAGITRGDSIVISGTVSEYYTYTELGSISSVTKVSSGNTLHPAYAITKLYDSNEEVEGVLVKVSNMPCIDASGSASYGEFTLYNGDTAKVGGLLYKYTTAAVGTNYDITGVVYSDYYHHFRVEPRDVNDVTVSTGINEYENNSITVYPNPVSSVLTVNNIANVDQIRISNILGQTIESIAVKGAQAEINVSNLTKGIYFISLTNNNNIVETKKFAKE
jgi:hypothetical protein